MIVGRRKPFDEIWAMVSGAGRVLVAGCGTCMTVCNAGGEKEAGVLASQLRLRAMKDGAALDVTEATVKRQCDQEFAAELDRIRGDIATVLSLGCGAGVQFLSERMKGAIVLPALDTVFIGVNDSPGVWSERCRACGSCRLHLTAGVCTVTRCSKGLMNGPCGGSWDGRCELSREIPCAWCEIWDRLKARGETFRYVSPPPRDWSAGFPGGPRRLDREEMK